MFGFKRKRGQKDKKRNTYDSIRLLYFNQPVDEMVSMIMDHESKTLELYWNGKLYVMSLDRLTVSYYMDIYASLIAQGQQIFTDGWPVMQKLLLSEREIRGQKNEIKNRDGLKIQYETKENRKLTCIITSEVLLYMPRMLRDLNEYIENKGYQRIEL